MTQAFVIGVRQGEKYLASNAGASLDQYYQYAHDKAQSLYKTDTKQQKCFMGFHEASKYHIFCSNRYVASSIQQCLNKINRLYVTARREQEGKGFLMTPSERQLIRKEHDIAYDLLKEMGVEHQHMTEENGLLYVPSFEVSSNKLFHAELICTKRDYEQKIEKIDKFGGNIHLRRKLYEDVQSINGYLQERIPEKTFEPIEGDIHIVLENKEQSNCMYKLFRFQSGQWHYETLVTNFGANSLDYHLEGYQIVQPGETRQEGYYSLRGIEETEQIIHNTMPHLTASQVTAIAKIMRPRQ